MTGRSAAFIIAVLTAAGLSHAAPDRPPSAAEPPDCGTRPAHEPLLSPFVTRFVGARPEAVAVGDFDQDGRRDVALLTSAYLDPANDNRLFVFLQNDHGGLSAPMMYRTTASRTDMAQSIAVGDLNGDGRDDVAVGTILSRLDFFYQNAAGGLDPAVTYVTDSAYSLKIGDLNGDGREDLVGISISQEKAEVRFQKPGGTLAAPVTIATGPGPWNEVEIGDINHDGRNDIVIAKGGDSERSVGLLIQKADGAFGPIQSYALGLPAATHGVAVGDLNGDVRSDVVVSFGGGRSPGGLGFFFQNPEGALESVRAHASYERPSAVEVGDLTGDGRDDAAVLHFGRKALGIYRQEAGCGLSPEERYPIPNGTGNPQGLALGDINGDGANDVLLPNYDGELVILYHASASGAPNLSIPSAVEFGKVTVGGAATRTISISNIGDAVLKITPAGLDGPDASEFRLVRGCSAIPAGEACAVTVRFAPVSGGGRTATLRIFSNDPDLPARIVSLRGDGVHDAVALRAGRAGMIDIRPPAR